MSRSSVKIVFSHSTESFRRRTFLCFRKSRVSKNIMPMKGISRFSIENFSSHSTNKLCNGTLLPLTIILATRKFMNRRGGGVTIFRPNCFFSQYRMISLGNPSVFQKFSGIEDFFA